MTYQTRRNPSVEPLLYIIVVKQILWTIFHILDYQVLTLCSRSQGYEPAPCRVRWPITHGPGLSLATMWHGWKVILSQPVSLPKSIPANLLRPVPVEMASMLLRLDVGSEGHVGVCNFPPQAHIHPRMVLLYLFHGSLEYLLAFVANGPIFCSGVDTRVYTPVGMLHLAFRPGC